MGLLTTSREEPTLRGKAKRAAADKKNEAKDRTANRAGFVNRCEVCGKPLRSVSRHGNRGQGEGVVCGKPKCLKEVGL